MDIVKIQIWLESFPKRTVNKLFEIQAHYPHPKFKTIMEAEILEVLKLHKIKLLANSKRASLAAIASDLDMLVDGQG